MRRLAAATLALAVSCSALPGAKANLPSGILGDAAREVIAITAPNADVVDRQFEDAIARADLQRTFGATAGQILDQIRKSRSAVAAMRASASGSTGSRRASVGASVASFSVTEFATQFANFLDQLTDKGGTFSLPGRPYSETESGADTTTTTTLSTTEIFSGSGSEATATVRWTYSTITLSTKPGGETLLHLQDDRELVGTINVCPDPGGLVPAKLHVTAKIATDVTGQTTTRNSTGVVEFSGNVHDSAALTSVTEKTKSEASWDGASGSGGYSADTTATWSVSGGGPLEGQMSSFDGSIVARGAASDADAVKGAGWDSALSLFAMDPSYQRAKSLWRGGRCVVVMAPDYNAETPIKVDQQTTPQHDEAVDQSSETKLQVKLRHRFAGGSLAQPVTTALAGEKTLEPNRLDGAGSLTYKAPDDEGKKATAKLTSTSKRGIGTLYLDFHTASQALTLTITGTLKSVGTFATTAEYQVTVGPLEFKKQGGDIWQAAGNWTTNIHTVATLGGSSQTCDGTEKGAVTWQVHTEKRGSSTVWVIDPNDADFDDGSGTENCFTPPVTIRGVTIGGNTTSDTPGGTGGSFASTLGSFTVPAEGGSIPVGGGTNIGGGRGGFVASGTAKAVTKK